MESKNKRIGRNDTEPIKQETSNHLFLFVSIWFYFKWTKTEKG